MIVDDPFAPPKTDAFVKAEPSEAERIRREMISHEQSVRSIGGLMILGTVFALLSAWISATTSGGYPWLAPVIVVLGVANGWAGWHVRRLDPRGRLPAAGLTALGIFGFPVGTIISAYFLYLLLSKKGAFVFSPEYKAIIEAAPDVKPRTPWVAIIVLFLFIVAILAAIAIPGMRTHR